MSIFSALTEFLPFGPSFWPCMAPILLATLYHRSKDKLRAPSGRAARLRGLTWPAWAPTVRMVALGAHIECWLSVWDLAILSLI